jgi:1,4-alpha-glucan branching enzyme
MTTQSRENSTAKNGATRQAKVSAIDVSRIVGEPQLHHNDKSENTKVQVQFKVAATDAKSVSVAGAFNDWNPQKTPLKKNGGGWKTTITLPRGRYEYRFVVDGQWVADPNATEAVANPFGGSNSVLNV